MTKDKTVTMSRGLAERLIRSIDEPQPSPLYAELRALLAAPVVERQEPHQIHDCCANCLQGNDAHSDDGKCPSPNTTIWHAWDYDFAPDTSPPAPVAVVHPFADKVISKLQRFEECASDPGADGVDIGRHWLDLLTQLGLLNRVQRSPALWEITQQGDDCLDKVKELNR